MTRLLVVPVVACMIATLVVSTAAASADPEISLQHLNSLKGTLNTGDGPLPVWHIYASPSPVGYLPVDAPGEGVACVDDVARALLVYLDHYELTGSTSSLEHARDAILFLAYMRQDDGTYANFVRTDGTRNLTGPTSRPGVNWWMARAMWGLARAKAVFAEVDPEYAESIGELLAPSVDRLKAAVAPQSGKTPPPRIVGGGADVTAVFLLAVSWLHTTTPSDELEYVASSLAQGLLESTAGDAGEPPYGVVMPNPGSPASWTGWGHHGVEALALAGRVFANADWTRAAADIANSLATYLVAGPGALAGQGPAPIRYPQIAYDQAPLVRGLVTLYETTGSDLYSDLAYLAASWLFGNNPVGEPMFQASTGVVYDGIDGDALAAPGRINYNAGAESTIEGLSMLLALKRLPESGLLSHADLRFHEGAGPIVVEAERYRQPGFGRIDVGRADYVDGSRPSGGEYLILHGGAQITLDVSALPGAYRAHLIHGGARTQPATVYLITSDEILATLEIERSPAGDRLRATDLGVRHWHQVNDRLHIVVENGSLAVDALLLHPAVMWRRLRGSASDVIAVRNMTAEPQSVTYPPAPDVRVRVYDRCGNLVAEKIGDTEFVLPVFGFAIVTYGG